MQNKLQNTNLASEFYVASQLFRLGYIVTLTLGHTKEIDLIVVNGNKIITIDVKGLKNTTNWPIALKSKKKNHFFALVAWNNKFENLYIRPDIFIIPSNRIKKLLTKWSGRPNVTCVNYSKVKNSKYKEAWKLSFK